MPCWRWQRPRLGERVLRGLLLAAWLLHALTLVEALLGTPPRFGFAPALSMTVWLVLTVYAVERRLFPQLQAHWALAGLGSAAVLLALLFPGASYHAIASPWLPLHWALGIASYGLFAAAVVHGWLMVRAERAIRQAEQTDTGVPLLTLERLTFRFVEAGFVLLSATLGWWAGCLPKPCTAQAWAGSGTTRRFSRCWPGPPSPACWWAVRAWAGAACKPFACSTWAPGCCCWAMPVRASCLKSS